MARVTAMASASSFPHRTGSRLTPHPFPLSGVRSTQVPPTARTRRPQLSSLSHESLVCHISFGIGLSLLRLHSSTRACYALKRRSERCLLEAKSRSPSARTPSGILVQRHCPPAPTSTWILARSTMTALSLGRGDAGTTPGARDFWNAGFPRVGCVLVAPAGSLGRLTRRSSASGQRVNGARI